MKKLSLFLIIFMMFSCSNEFETSLDEVEQSLSVLDEEKLNLKHAADGKYDLLGFSYDITKEYLHVDAAPRTVLDIDAFVRDHESRYYHPGTTIGKNAIYAGATSADFVEDLKEKTITSANMNCPGNVFSANLKITDERDKKYKLSSKYSYARADAIKRVKRLYLDADLELLINYVRPVFYENLDRYSPDEFVRTYGTHVLTDITIGGRLSFLYRSAIMEESDYTRKKTIVEAGANMVLDGFGFAFSSTEEKERATTLNKSNTTWSVELEFHGGESSGRKSSFNITTGVQADEFNISDWEKGVVSTNAALVDINWNKAYYIYEFIKDPDKKQKIKDAVERYMQKTDFEVMEIVPLYEWYNQINKCCAYTIDMKYHYGPGWYRKGVVAYVSPKKESYNTPLYQWANYHKWTYAYTIDSKYSYGSGWVKEGAWCYVYPEKIAGTVPFNQHFDLKDGYYFYTTDSSGYNDPGRWENYGHYWYVFPAYDKY